MYWNRREFIRFIGGMSAAALTIQKFPWCEEFVTPPILASIIHPPWMVEMSAYTTSNEPGRIVIARPDGTRILVGAVGPRGFYLWRAALGNEIYAADGLVNLSDSGLNVRLTFTDGPRIWVVEDNKITFFRG